MGKGWIFHVKKGSCRFGLLRGKEKEIEGRVYDCQIRDLEGKTYEFKTHSLDKVTGDLEDAPSKGVLQKLFPDVWSAWDTTSFLDIDYLIGLVKASWHPARYKRAKQGGDLCIWSNNFGSCLCGSHPLISAYCKQSIHLYTVLKTVAVEWPGVRQFCSCMAFLMESFTNKARDAISKGQLRVEPKWDYGSSGYAGCPDCSPSCSSCRGY